MKTNKEILFDELVRLGNVKSEAGLNYLRKLTLSKMIKLIVNYTKTYSTK